MFKVCLLYSRLYIRENIERVNGMSLILESGTHEELIRMKGYYDLYKLQNTLNLVESKTEIASVI